MKLLLFAISSLLFQPLFAEEPSRISLAAVEDRDSESVTAMKFRDDGTSEAIFVAKTPILTDKEIAKAELSDSQEVTILVTMTKEGAGILDAATKALVGKRLAILVNGDLVSAPTVQNPFSTGMTITGNFKREWAEQLVRDLNAAAER